MNREISFRMWSDVLKQMYYPDTNEANLWRIPEAENGILKTDDLRNILMQFTGKFDYEGKGIFEGDFIEFTWFFYSDIEIEEKKIGRIVWDKQGMCFSFIENDNEEYLIPFSDLQFDSESDIKVIGNIFETPYFLEQTKVNIEI